MQALVLRLAQHARGSLDDRIGLQVRSAFPGLVVKRLVDVWVCLECFLGLSLAARASAERAEASEAVGPRAAAGVLDDDICAHLMRAALQMWTHASGSTL